MGRSVVSTEATETGTRRETGSCRPKWSPIPTTAVTWIPVSEPRGKLSSGHLSGVGFGWYLARISLQIHIVSQVKTIQNQSYNLMKFNLPILHFFIFWKKLNMRHTFWSCLIRYVNMKWIWQVLLKIQRGHHSVHRWTDGQGETNIPPSSREYDYYINTSNGSWCQGIMGNALHSLCRIVMEYHLLNMYLKAIICHIIMAKSHHIV